MFATFTNIHVILFTFIISINLTCTNRSFRYASPYLWNQLPHAVDFILFTLRLVHIFLRISPTHSHHLRSPWAFHSRLTRKQKFRPNLTLRQFKVIQGHLCINRKITRDFLLVINSNFGRICNRFRDV